MLRLCILFAAPVVIFFAGGCGGSKYPTAPVSGTVTMDGKPLANGSLTYQPEGGGMASHGRTDESGRYTLKSIRDDFDGAVVAKHRVIIRTVGKSSTDTSSDRADPTAVDPIPKKYNDATELTMEVPAEGRDDADFDLKK
jgi:hypothetical protein